MTIPDTIDRFFQAWNATSPDERRAAVEAAWTPDASVKDPLADVRGHDQIAAFLGEAVSQFPGHSFRRVGGIDGHHDLARFAWHLVGPDGHVVVEGLEVATIADDGRLSSTIGFFGPVPAQDEEAAA